MPDIPAKYKKEVREVYKDFPKEKLLDIIANCWWRIDMILKKLKVAESTLRELKKRQKSE